MNRVSRNPRVPEAEYKVETPRVRVHYYFASGCLSIPFPLQLANLKEGNLRQMWEFIRIHI